MDNYSEKDRISGDDFLSLSRSSIDTLSVIYKKLHMKRDSLDSESGLFAGGIVRRPAFPSDSHTERYFDEREGTINLACDDALVQIGRGLKFLLNNGKLDKNDWLLYATTVSGSGNPLIRRSVERRGFSKQSIHASLSVAKKILDDDFISAEAEQQLTDELGIPPLDETIDLPSKIAQHR